MVGIEEKQAVGRGDFRGGMRSVGWPFPLYGGGISIGRCRECTYTVGDSSSVGVWTGHEECPYVSGHSLLRSVLFVVDSFVSLLSESR